MLSKQELIEGLKVSKLFINQNEIDELFQKIDQNGNQTLDYTEFVAAAIDKKLALSEEKIKHCFQLLDKN